MHAIQQHPIPVPVGGTVSQSFIDFLTLSLQKDEKLRPNADKLLSHPFLGGFMKSPLVSTSNNEGRNCGQATTVDINVAQEEEEYDFDEFEDGTSAKSESMLTSYALVCSISFRFSGSGHRNFPANLTANVIMEDLVRPVKDWVLRHPLQNNIQIVHKSNSDFQHGRSNNGEENAYISEKGLF